MPGIIHLKKLLTEMNPQLDEQEYVFGALPRGLSQRAFELNPLATIQEEEGLSVVLERHAADSAGLGYDSVFKKITLSVHSSLEAVGFTAAVSTALTEHQISANVIAGYHHDHVLVPSEKAEEAMAVLNKLTSGSPQT